VILLHGFPEHWYGWHHQINALVEAGLFVTAPDMRGYNLSEKPRGIRAYGLNHLAADVVGLIDALGVERVGLVGHDWGGVIAWWVAQNYPERIERLAILNAPHPEAYRRYVIKHPRQMLVSWYIGFFQIPLLPEALARRGFWRKPPPDAAPDAFTESDLTRYRDAIEQPRAMRSMINYYRAGRFPQKPRIASPQIHIPTLILWGQRDLYLDALLARRSADLCDDARVVLHRLSRPHLPQRTQNTLAHRAAARHAVQTEYRTIIPNLAKRTYSLFR
jgi:pimeloyl-ACP methyl ester carboxylesterase